MRKVFIGLAVLALAGAAFFFYQGHHQQGNRDRELQFMQEAVAAAKAAAVELAAEPERAAQEIERHTQYAASARSSIEHYEGERNICYGIGAGGLLFAAGFVWLARRKPRAIAA